MNQIIMILLISVLVMVHELGHFVAARLCGVRVTRFGFGMPIGPSLKLFRWKHTDFYIHAFLFGGYVSFADDEISNDEKKQKDAESDEETLPSDSPELYENKTIAQKLFIVTAGVLMNVVFAVFLVMFAALYYHKLPASQQNIYVESFTAKVSSNAEAMGLKKGDKIYKINDTNIDTLYKLNFFAKNSKLYDDYAQQDLYEKKLSELKKLNPDIKDIIKENETIKLPKTEPENPLKVNKNVLTGLEKYKKDGIKLSEGQIKLRKIILKNNKKYTHIQSDSLEKFQNLTLEDVAMVLADTYKPVNITVIRDGKEVTIKNIIIQEDGLLGIMLKLEDKFSETKTPYQIITKSCSYLYTTTSTMLFSLWQLITGKVSASEMHGVIAIVKVGGDIIASKGMLNGILLTAMISINLAIMNILPIPALDGGHVAFLITEKLTGKKPNKEQSEKINNFFFILLIVLMISICYNDILALITKKF